jgi:hypothetical protein
LSDLPGVQWTIDQENQIVKITAASNSLLPLVLQPGRLMVEGRRRIESGTGLTLNYDVVSTFTSGLAGATSAFDMRTVELLYEFAGWAQLIRKNRLKNAG